MAMLDRSCPLQTSQGFDAASPHSAQSPCMSDEDFSGGGRTAQAPDGFGVEYPLGWVRLTWDINRSRSPSQLAATLRDVDALYWAAVYNWRVPKWFVSLPEGGWHWPFSVAGWEDEHLPEEMSVRLLRYGSPFSLLLEIPSVAWASGGSLFVGALATVYNLPSLAAKYQAARRAFWEERLEADNAKQAWIDAARERNRGSHVSEISTTRLPPIE
jgi:hypothetical protein